MTNNEKEELDIVLDALPDAASTAMLTSIIASILVSYLSPSEMDKVLIEAKRLALTDPTPTKH